MTSIWKLSEELLEEIASWLPVDSLICMKCVDKYWYRLLTRLIKSKPFVAKHLKNFNSRSHSPLLLRSIIDLPHIAKCRDDALLRLVRKDDHLEPVIESIDIEYLSVNGFEIGWGQHCNGIICTPLRRRRVLKVALYNPALRHFKFISGSCYGEDGRFVHDQRLGFGHDPIANAYKVIRFVSLEYCSGDLAVEIHTVGVDDHDSWRKIELQTQQVDSEVYCISLQRLDSDVCCNGFYYWSVKYFPILLSFNMHEEKFQSILLPFPSEREQGVFTQLALWNNHSQVAVFRYADYGDRVKPIEMWVLHEGDDKTSYSWTKYLTTPPLEKFYQPLLFWDNDEVLLVSQYATCDQELASYNLRTREVRSLQGITYHRILMADFCVLPYVQSLVAFD